MTAPSLASVFCPINTPSPAAREQFQAAIAARHDCGTAHVNLALLALADAQVAQPLGTRPTGARPGAVPTSVLEAAAAHCRQALAAEDRKRPRERDAQASATAERLLGDLVKSLRGDACTG